MCGTCQPQGTPAVCRPLDASAAGQGCSGQPPVCFRACGDFTPASPSLASCGTAGWGCTGGVMLEDCPTDVCWGEARVGQVCVDGHWICQYGEARPGVCLTPGACESLDGGPTVAPGCVYAPTCQGTMQDCAPTWCSQGVVTPAVCAAGRFQCAQGMLVDSCTTCAGDAPTCHAACGDNTVVAVGICQGGLWACPNGVARTACPPSVCWGARPAGSVGCVDGVWACGDAGPAPGRGCLTPGACLGPAPECYPDLCCTQASTPAQCADLAWSCGSWSTLQDCGERPFCPSLLDGGFVDAGRLDGGALDAATSDAAPLDAGVVDLDAATPDAAEAGPAQDAGAVDAATTDAAQEPVDASVPMGGSTPVCGDDVYEPNNTVAQVAPVLPGPFGSFLGGSPLQVCLGDVDLWPFQVPAGAMVTVALEHTMGAQVTLDLFAPDGTFLARGMPSGMSGGRDTQVLVATVAGAGTVLVAITSDDMVTAAYAMTVGLQ